ncbi:MAG TPA: hypothetical protein VND45_03220 [Thermoanaerobaculia bacterium]|nr:hypothetical protein [Thermoanaerobaculia bacterium]
MKRMLIAALLVAMGAAAQDTTNVAQRVADDAIAIDRVAAASKRDLPTDLLRRMIDEDVDLLRGRRNDGSYQYASFERFDSGRISQDYSVRYRGDKMEVLEIKGPWVYRVQVEVPSRRMVVRTNRPVWIERVDLEYVAERGSQTERQTIEIKQWLKPGEFRPVDLPQIARQATARVVTSVEKDAGYGNVELALIKAKIVDNADSPYADAVASAKAIQRALDSGDVPSMRSMAQRMRSTLARSGAAGFSPPAEAPAGGRAQCGGPRRAEGRRSTGPGDARRVAGDRGFADRERAGAASGTRSSAPADPAFAAVATRPSRSAREICTASRARCAANACMPAFDGLTPMQR